MPASGISGLSNYLGSGGSYDGVADAEIGPYAGTLTTNATGALSPNSVFFCLTGNQYYQQPEYGNDGPANKLQSGGSNNLLTVQEQEEAAFLVSVFLTDKAADGVTLTVNGKGGNGSGEYLSASGTDVSDFEKALGPIQLAIWYVAQTLPSSLTCTVGPSCTYQWNYTSVSSITDSAVSYLVQEAINAAKNPTQWYDTTLQVFAYGTDSGGQNFISTAAPEPGTMVLFGTGGLLIALGSARKLLARRRAR
jgi:hypothetical protein